MPSHSPPSQIIIIGAGVFGISTARALLSRPKYSNCKITILDASPKLPNPSGSSVDSSRIVRPDYANATYASLAIEAQKLWRDTSDGSWGGQDRYHEPGFLITADIGAEWYVTKSLHNVRSLAESSEGVVDKKRIEELPDKEAIRRASGYTGVSGDSGYVNWGSGWADAELCVQYALECLEREANGRVSLKSNSKVRRLLYDKAHDDQSAEVSCIGVE